jgi:lipid-A-disaccharide synthase
MMAPAPRPPRLHLVAAEESGDALGGALMEALRGLDGAISFTGVGGRAMAAQGIVSPFDIADLSIIGVASIPARLPRILRRIR